MLVVLTIGVLPTLYATAAIFVWNGGGSDANWSTPANWTGSVVPTNDGTATIVLAGTNQLGPNVDTNWNISSLVFSNNAGAFVLNGSALNIRAGGVTNSSANAQIINNAITLATNQTWSATSGILTFNGNVNNVTNLLTIAGNFNGSVADGTWTLFFADLASGGGTSELNSWSLGITVVPEPINAALGLFGVLFAAILIYGKPPGDNTDQPLPAVKRRCWDWICPPDFKL